MKPQDLGPDVMLAIYFPDNRTDEPHLKILAIEYELTHAEFS